jgi:hypothetical protein
MNPLLSPYRNRLLIICSGITRNLIFACAWPFLGVRGHHIFSFDSACEKCGNKRSKFLSCVVSNCSREYPFDYDFTSTWRRHHFTFRRTTRQRCVATREFRRWQRSSCVPTFVLIFRSPRSLRDRTPRICPNLREDS